MARFGRRGGDGPSLEPELQPGMPVLEVGHQQHSLPSLSLDTRDDDDHDEESLSFPQVIGLLEIRHKSSIGYLRAQQAKHVALELQVQRDREQLVTLREEHSQELAAMQVAMETLRREHSQKLAALQVEMETGRREKDRDLAAVQVEVENLRVEVENLRRENEHLLNAKKSLKEIIRKM